MHWINVVCLTVLLMSGLNIFNAHPALYWGRESTFAQPWISFGSRTTAEGSTASTASPATSSGPPVSSVCRATLTATWRRARFRRGRRSRATNGWRWGGTGTSSSPGSSWINGIVYLLYTIFSRHLKMDLVPTRDELKNIGRSIVDHIKLKHPTGAAATRYNVLQSLTYLIVIFGLLPLVVFAGLAMSPRIDTVFTGWVDLLGGRQSARTLHFLAAFGLLLFVVVHVAEVFIAGVFFNEMRSMITGWYAVPEERRVAEEMQP